jgi:osmoprotectant transport system substrate-binding protein
MKRTSLLASLAVVAATALAGCGGGDDALDTSSGSSGDSGGSAGALVVGSANFPENALLAEIYAGALNGAGVEAETKLNIGSRETYLPGMQDGSLDVFPEYTGVLRDYFAAADGTKVSATDPDGVYKELQQVLPDDLVVLPFAEAEDKDGVVVTQDTAEKYSLSSIADLAPVAGDLTLAGPPEWKTRQTGLPGLKDVYGVVFGTYIPKDAGGPLTLKAILNGQADAGNLFTTDPNIAANDLVVLDDPKSLFAAQNVVPLLTKDADNPDVEDALNAVSDALDTDTLGALVKQVVIDKEDPEDVAKQFLDDNNLS